MHYDTADTTTDVDSRAGLDRESTFWQKFHEYSVITLLIAFAFVTAYLYRREQILYERAEQLREYTRALELANSVQTEDNVNPGGTAEKGRSELEHKLRQEYEATLNAIRAELAELYDMEAKARSLTGLAPRKPSTTLSPSGNTGGKGGPEGGTTVVTGTMQRRIVPPAVIVGMQNPPADLILQEIQVRKMSLAALVREVQQAREVVERKPTYWPLVRGMGKITSRFGYRRDPFNGRIRHHDGTDISAPYGTPVRATARGVVIASGWDGDLGNCIRIDHGNGLVTVYGHLSQRTVSVGTTVQKGDIIGKVGSTGRSTGPHLHYEVHVRGNKTNPEKYLND
jgi:murein DD-endopeptidase MepM/ murein hydrolase activator NlpD